MDMVEEWLEEAAKMQDKVVEWVNDGLLYVDGVIKADGFYEIVMGVTVSFAIVFSCVLLMHGYKSHKRRGELMRKQEEKLRMYLSDRVTDMLEDAYNQGMLSVKSKRTWYMNLGQGLKLHDLIYRPGPKKLKALIRYRLGIGVNKPGFDYTPVQLPEHDVDQALLAFQQKFRAAAAPQ